MATELLLVNPKRKRKRKASTKRRTTTARRRTVRRNPTTTKKRSTRRIRRNPRRNGIVSDLVAAGIGAGGALGVDVAFAYLPLPVQYKTGMMGTVAKMGTAIAAGEVLKMTKLVKKPMAEKLVIGALLVQAHSLLKTQLQAAMPTLPLGEYMTMGGGSALPYASPGLGYTNAAMSVPMSMPMGEYMTGAAELSGEMDYYSGSGMYS